MQLQKLLLLGSLLSSSFAAPVEERKRFSSVEEEDSSSSSVFPVFHLLNDESGKETGFLRRRDLDTANLPDGAEHKTVTTSVNGQYGTYLEVVYTSTIRPASTYVVTTTIYSTKTLQDGQVTTITSVAGSTTTQSAIYATEAAQDTEDDSTTPSATSSLAQETGDDSATETNNAATTVTAESSSSSSSVSHASTSLSVSFASNTDSASYTAYYTETVDDGTCIVYYAEDDETASYSDEDPYTTVTLTSVVATVTMTQD
ncbi:hypothetical protein FOA43_004214 [Brettanomyces nanus]|uniref:Uncharacterized protein n=1 Tax=Eeniella nana TaxID=13502 RepID=A0A875RQF8_EENNA|nr:uncharacterized protein FOA43_004214 [Brettanomyces nanus]QPG76820.1 hypothetical protein FOA43_004214 [Brettanomyces nanus]